MSMQFIVSSVSEGAVKATTIIEGNPSGFRIEITGGKQAEVYTSKADFSMSVLSDIGIRAFFEKNAWGLYSSWFKEAVATTERLKGSNKPF